MKINLSSRKVGNSEVQRTQGQTLKNAEGQKRINMIHDSYFAVYRGGLQTWLYLIPRLSFSTSYLCFKDSLCTLTTAKIPRWLMLSCLKVSGRTAQAHTLNPNPQPQI